MLRGANTYQDKLWPTVWILAAVVVGLAVLWLIADAVLLVFAGILLAILFRAIADLVARYTPVPEKASLAVGLIGLAALLGLVGYLYAPAVADQAQQMREVIPQRWNELRQQLSQYGVTRGMLDDLRLDPQSGSGPGRLLGRVTGMASTALSVLAGIVIVFAIGLFVAANPALYRQGVVRLTPHSHRERALEILDELGHTLRGWLVGQLIAMGIIGVLTGIGLAIIGVPFVFGLSLLAVLLNFIPNFGPVLAGIPAVLLALTNGMTDALWVIALYVGAQNVEGNFLMPIIQRRIVSIAPAVILTCQVAFGLLFGFLGVALAAPLAVALMVLVRMIYVEDVLGDKD